MLSRRSFVKKMTGTLVTTGLLGSLKGCSNNPSFISSGIYDGVPEEHIKIFDNLGRPMFLDKLEEIRDNLGEYSETQDVAHYLKENYGSELQFRGQKYILRCNEENTAVAYSNLGVLNELPTFDPGSINEYLFMGFGNLSIDEGKLAYVLGLPTQKKGGVHLYHTYYDDEAKNLIIGAIQGGIWIPSMDCNLD